MERFLQRTQAVLTDATRYDKLECVFLPLTCNIPSECEQALVREEPHGLAPEGVGCCPVLRREVP